MWPPTTAACHGAGPLLQQGMFLYAVQLSERKTVMLCACCLINLERTRATYVIAVQYPPNCDACRNDFETHKTEHAPGDDYDKPMVAGSCYTHATLEITRTQRCPHGYAMRFSEPAAIQDNENT